MTKRLYILLYIAAASAIAAGAAETADTSATRHRTLRAVEVMGVKQDAALESSMSAVTQVGGGKLRRLGINATKGLSEIAPNFLCPTTARA